MTDVQPATDADVRGIREFVSNFGDTLTGETFAKLLARLDAATARIAEVEAERDEWVKTAEAFEAKWQAICTAPRNDGGTCACSYDAPGEVCLYHSPKLVAATARAETAERKLKAAREALRQAYDDTPGWAAGWVRHKKRGSIYAVVGTASLQTVGSIDEGASLVIYRGASGELWARPKGEFHDGRFEALPAAPKGGEG